MYNNLINNSIVSFEKYNFFNIFDSNNVSLFYKSIKYINSDKDLIYHYKRFGTSSIDDIFNTMLINLS